MKYLAYLMTALILLTAAEANAKGNNHNHKNAAQLKAAKAAQAKREKESKERDEKNKKIKNFLEQYDTNHDGSVSRNEFTARETSQKALQKFESSNKNGDSYLTKTEIADMLDID